MARPMRVLHLLALASLLLLLAPSVSAKEGGCAAVDWRRDGGGLGVYPTSYTNAVGVVVDVPGNSFAVVVAPMACVEHVTLA